MNYLIEDKLDRFLQKNFGIEAIKVLGNEDYVPCYSVRFSTDERIDTKEKIKKYYEFCRKLHEKGVAIFSVTEEDKNHKLWVEVAKELKYNVTVCQSRIHGEYKCWFIAAPCNKRLK